MGGRKKDIYNLLNEARMTGGHAMSEPTHAPDEALRLIRECHKQGTPVTDAALIEFIAKPINYGRPTVAERTGPGRKSTKTQYDVAAKWRRSFFHKLVRLEANRSKAAAVRLSGGKPSRETVFALAAEAMKAGATKRQLRGKIKALAAKRGMTIPGDWQLGKLINEFMKVDTTT